MGVSMPLRNHDGVNFPPRWSILYSLEKLTICYNRFLSNAYKLCFWALAYILFNPSVYKAIQEEVDMAMSDGMPDLVSRLEQSPHLMSLYHEVLRLTTASASIRTVESATPLGRYVLRPGAKVLLPFRQLHFNEDVFGVNAAGFDSERFLRDESLSKSSSFRPFGGGSTYCPGRYVARWEVLTFIALAMSRFHLSLQDANQAVFPQLDTKKPSLGIMMPLAGQDVRMSVKKR